MNNEEILLNSIIQIKKAFFETREFLNDKSWEDLINKKVYELICKIVEDGKQIDLVTLVLYAQELKVEQVIDRIYSITNTEPTLNYLDFAKNLNKKECLKAQNDLALKLLDASKNGNLLSYEDVMNLIKVPKTMIYKTAAELYYEMSEEIKTMTLYPTGISVIDRCFKGGFQTGGLILINGEPEAGKSMFGLQAIENIARAKHRAAYFCFEFLKRDYIQLKMNVDKNLQTKENAIAAEENEKRALKRQARIKQELELKKDEIRKLQNKNENKAINLEDKEVLKLLDIKYELDDEKPIKPVIITPFFKKENFNNLEVIDEDYGINEVAMHIRKLCEEKNVKFFLIDSQMRLEVNNGRSLEEEESRKFSTLAKLAHSLDICIILIVQTSKTDTQTPAGTKKGAHEAKAIIRIETVKENKSISATKRYIIVQKNKQSGAHDSFLVEFDPNTCKFGERIMDKKDDENNKKKHKVEDL
ncbi:ATPase domain-containing protein [Campylobacter sp. RM12651]|uniref:ATPase domain-containing protein n=1 Tax=Campylobacter sp. RM12651 TaxID=1660079 RepID=UPI001EFC0413|nr:ATPase domain-containing protein [Campylobacter sp. RM12651]ULO02911.1 RecA family protein [Campylobacter sp. RM12651]